MTLTVSDRPRVAQPSAPRVTLATDHDRRSHPRLYDLGLPVHVGVPRSVFVAPPRVVLLRAAPPGVYILRSFPVAVPLRR